MHSLATSTASETGKENAAEGKEEEIEMEKEEEEAVGLVAPLTVRRYPRQDLGSR